jgi:hypothetical protein
MLVDKIFYPKSTLLLIGVRKIKPSIVVANNRFFSKVLDLYNFQYSYNGVYKFTNCSDHAMMIAINEVFSKSPKHQPVDRTGLTKSPLNQHIERPWKIPTQQLSLDQAFKERVDNLLSTQQRINLFWSGGIDSTAMITAFLKHSPDKKQLRILYSPYSTYEHPGYLEFLKKNSDLELVDISGTVYLNCQFDGIFITGDGGDELMGSLDETFFETHGADGLSKSWKDFFYQENPDSNFIEFCEKHFAQAGRPIDTVLDARWWFYTTCKNTAMLYDTKLPYFLDYDNFNVGMIHGFFDCYEFEKYIYWNTDKIITSSDYSGWKQIFKNYCCEFDGFKSWSDNKTKVNSGQTIFYMEKKIILKNLRWIMLLTDGTRITTPNLPLFSENEYREKYNTQLDYLFNVVN